ncbi:MAG: hypothetical protein QOG35_3158 [Solirubrobacteraceae bacterium]|jgi:hypothetical protein|nr:hypothetical protein [Solirubrobacteraceae bacterium]
MLAGVLALAALALALPGIAAADRRAPSAVTGAATDVGTDAATLHGTLVSDGDGTSYFFQYGVDGFDRHTPVAWVDDDREAVAVSAPVTGLTPATSYHARLVVFDRRRFAVGDDLPFTTLGLPAAPSPALAPAPVQGASGQPVPAGAPGSPAPPVLGESVGVAPRTGSVEVKVPGSSDFVALSSGASVPVGSLLDTRAGAVTLSAAVAGGRTQAAVFHGGLFEVRQPTSGRGLTELVLRGPRPSCGAGTASAAAVRKRKPPRALWGHDNHGTFRTRGSNSVATVRGTVWYVEDRCDGTLTRVRSGSVSVRDLRRHRTVVVRAGQSYLARAKR